MHEMIHTQLLKILKKNTGEAAGCTEPISIALAGARIKELLGGDPDKIELFLSANIIKNVNGVSIPNIKEMGSDIIFAMGLAIGIITDDKNTNFNILGSSTKEHHEKALDYIKQGIIKVQEKENTEQSLYIEALGFKGTNKAQVIISKDHDNFVVEELNGICKKKMMAPKEDLTTENKEDLDYSLLTLQNILEFGKNCPIEDIAFLKRASDLNNALSIEGLKGDYRLEVGKTHLKKMQEGIESNNLKNRVIARTTAANDARMGGCPLSAFTNSGSGNQGIACTMPVVVTFEDLNLPEEDLMRALTVSHLTTIMIRSRMGKLTPTCGASLAAIGSITGILTLKKASYMVITNAIINIIGNITGIICDGAKGSCPLKVETGIHAAFTAMYLAENNKVLNSHDGIVGNDLESTIKHLVSINNAMKPIEKTMISIFC